VRLASPLALIAVLLAAAPAAAALVEAEPTAPIVAPFPANVPAIETQVVLQLVVDARGVVESAVETSRVPRRAPEAFSLAAIEAAKAATFTPSMHDGQPVRSRIEYVVVFHPPPAPPHPSPPPAPLPVPAPSGLESVTIQGFVKPAPRGLGDMRIDREQLAAAPHQQTSEMLSAAPGFFVDHEDGEGLGNDVYLRGFDLDNGSGIEMKVGGVPINIPLHIHGQGYADVNFIIPEVVQSIRVLEGSYDPRQGDSAIVGSAYFDLGVPERGYFLKSTYGSFGQARVVGVVAPKDANDETFAAFALRETRGFGQDRASKSASVNAQYGVDLGASDHLRVLATAYAARGDLPGVVRQDDVNAGRIGYYDAYPHFNSFFPSNCDKASCAEPAQGIESSRIVLGAALDHTSASGSHSAIAPWVMWSNFRSRQNYTGDLNSSNLQPELASLGDLWQLTNVETAGGLTAFFRSAEARFENFLEVVAEPGVFVRGGHTNQTRSLLNPSDLDPWDDRQNDGLNTIDLAGYVDLDVRLWKKLRISGGVRADFLAVSIKDNLEGIVPPIATGALQGAQTDVAGVAPGLRATAAYEIIPELTPVISAGQGFRSLDAGSLTLCNAPAVKRSETMTAVPPCAPGSPYSQVVSFEAGLRSEVGGGRFTTTLAAFQTDVANELVFEVASGGLTTENASTRRGVVGSFVARPFSWLLASTALSVQTATFDTLVVGGSHYVPNVPAVLWRLDVTAHGELFRIQSSPVSGRVGAGYTLLGGRHVNDVIIAPTNNVLNALASLRYRFVEVGVDGYNLLNLKYADDEEYYVSNWSLKPGQQRASTAVHLVAAPPLTALGTLTLHL
jgi:iron complex outermembrane receptor protein